MVRLLVTLLDTVSGQTIPHYCPRFYGPLGKITWPLADFPRNTVLGDRSRPFEKGTPPRLWRAEFASTGEQMTSDELASMRIGIFKSENIYRRAMFEFAGAR